MDNTEYLKQLAETEKKNKQIELEQAKAAALKSIGQQEATTMPTFTAQKKQASVQSQLGAKNLAEYWANRGQTQAGISAQAELSRQNALTGQLSGIGQNEAAQQLAFNQARDTAGTEYQNQMTNFSNQVDQELATNLYNDKLAQQEAAAKAAQQAFENQMDVLNYNLKVNNQSGGGSGGSGGTAKTGILPLDKVGKYANVTIPYSTSTTNRPIVSNVRNGDKVTYNLANGSQITFDLGTNPYTGTLNKDAVETISGVKTLKTFANGYQPNNVNGTKLVNTGAVVNNNSINEQVRVWTTGDGNFYYWDSSKNKYQKLTQNEAKAVGVVASTKSTGGTTSKGYSPNTKSVGFR